MNTKSTHAIVFKLMKNPHSVSKYWEKYHSYKTIESAEQALNDLTKKDIKNSFSSRFMKFKIVPYFKGEIYRDSELES